MAFACCSLVMKLLKNAIIMRLFVYSLALFYGGVVVAKIFWSWIWHPTKKFWRVKRREIAPETMTDPARGTHCYAQLKNIKLHYVEKGDKTKPLMLFVHGFPEFWYSWRHQMDEFSKDYWTVAVDMRGYGDSDKPDGIKNYSMKYLINDIKDLVEFLGREKFTLVAHDWGGVIAWTFLDTFPEMLDRYVIMDAPRSSMWLKLALTRKKQFLMSWYVFFYQLPYLPEFTLRCNDMGLLGKVFRAGKPKEKTAITDDDIEAYKYTFGKPGAFTGPINYYRANTLRQRPNATGKDKTENSPPGLFIFGEKDLYLDVEMVEMTKKEINNLTTKVVAGGNHFVQQDVPKTVNKIMNDFFHNK